MKQQGYMVIVDPAMPTREWDTITCAHGNEVFRVKEDPGGFCLKCMKPICAKCAYSGSCTPFEKQLEAWERRDRFHRELGI